jgi:Zn-dependent protease with chaperone function
MAGQTVKCPICHQDFAVGAAASGRTPPKLPEQQKLPLTLSNLTLPKETTYLVFVVLVSIVMWGLALMTIFLAFIALFLGIAIWFANGLLVARLKAEAVKIDQTQLPRLATAFQEVCRQVGVAPVPDLYVVQSGGLLNAFTSKHAGRNFVVLYSELLETYGPDSPEIRFLLGHELGHIRSRHILKQILLAPGLLMPLLGNAYNRACEASSDRYGAFVSGDINGSINAMMILAGGKHAKALMDPVPFAAQYRKFRGFFVSWHELISGYPTLSQRVANLVSLGEGREPVRAPRHPLSYVFAFFSIGGQGGGGANLMITVAVIGLLAAIAIPSFVQARTQSQRNLCINHLRQIEGGKEQWALENKKEQGAAVSLDQIKPFLKTPEQVMKCPAGGEVDLGVIGANATCTAPKHELSE